MKYFVSTINYSPYMKENISDVVPEMIDNGIKNIEISSFHPYEENLDLKKYKADILLHNFAPPTKKDFLINLCGEEIGEISEKFIKYRIIQTKHLGQDYYSFHAGFRVNQLQTFSKDKNAIEKRLAMNRFIDRLGRIVKFAEEQKIHIGVENHCCIRQNKDNLILYETNDWDELFSRIDSRYLHLHLDIGHLKISSTENDFDPNEFLDAFGHKVKAVHVHDNTGWKVDSHAPFNNDFWFKEHHWRFLNNLDYVILETKTYKDLELINYMIDFMDDEI